MADCFLALVCQPGDRMTAVRLGLPGHVETIARSAPVAGDEDAALSHQEVAGSSPASSIA